MFDDAGFEEPPVCYILEINRLIVVLIILGSLILSRHIGEATTGQTVFRVRFGSG